MRSNVTWYFSPPLDQPGDAAVLLDCVTTYNVGAVGTDLGPLAIGNFNQTMHSYGLARQFRGEIRALQIFGSRLSGRGALSLEAIRSHVLISGDAGRSSPTPGSVKGASGSVQPRPDAARFITIQVGARPERVT